MLCPVCLKIIQNPELEFLLGIDRPYINVYIHRECRQFVDNDFIRQNVEILYNTYIEQLKIKKNGKK